MVVFGALEPHAVLFHGLCLGLAVVDAVARSFRIGFVMNAMHARIPVESIVNYIVLTVIGIALAAAFGSAWAAVLHKSVSFALHPTTLVVTAVVVACGVFALSRMPSHLVRRARVFVAHAVRALRRVSPRDLVVLTTLSAISLVARIAILPFVVAAFGEPVPVGAVSLASFALLNGQILAPTPSGAGAVELAAASGFIGTEAHTGAIVAAWCVYVTILPIVAGLLFAAGRYGPCALLIILKRRDAS
jgi:uncharacterized membrane protein YbhN (UPF0104 family)